MDAAADDPMKRCILILLMLLALCFVPPVWAGRVVNDAFVSKPFSHQIWQEVLSTSVNADGSVDLVHLRAYPLRLNQYLSLLAKVSPDTKPDDFPTYYDRLAYWINARNALALRLVLNAFPVETLDAIPNFMTDDHYKFGGKPYSLSQLNDRIASEFMLRPQAYFALSDLSYGSPKLLDQAYSPDKITLEHQLESVTQAFLSDPNNIVVDQPQPGECATLEISAWLKPFEPAIARYENADQGGFKPDHTPTFLDFIERYIQPDAHAFLYEDCGHPIKYIRPDNRLRQL